MSSYTYQDYQKEQSNRGNNNYTNNYNPENNIGYFNLKEDGEEAIVRFLYTSPSEFKLFRVHQMQIDGKWKKIDCLNTPYENNLCPICKSGLNKTQKKFYIQLLQYVKDDNGHIVALPKIWDRPDNYADRLSNLFTEYGDISEMVFKVKRNGKPKDNKTTYDIMYANPVIYKPEIYVKKEDAFKDFDFHKWFIQSKTAEEMQSIVDSLKPNQQEETTTPVKSNVINEMVAPQPQQPTYNTPMNENVVRQTSMNNDYNNMSAPRRTYNY